MSGGSSSPPSTNTVQSSEPPSFLQPYLKDAAGSAQDIYNSGGAAYYPGQAVATPSDQTTQGLNSITDLAQQGGTLTPAANNTLLSTINGTGGVNPFLANAVQSANAPLFEQFQNQTVPGLQSIFARAGGTGGSAENAAFDQATTAFGRGVGQNAGTLAYQAADQERKNQLNAAVLAPQMDMARYNDANALLGVGATYDAQNQANINADINKYNYNATLPATSLNQYIQQLTASYPGSSGSANVSNFTPHPVPSIGSSYVNGVAGAGAGAIAGSPGGPPGMAAGALLGGIYGSSQGRGWF